MTQRVYLDYNATAPLRPQARAAMLDALGAVGNASSVHGEGRDARRRIEAARVDVARLVGGDAKLVTFDQRRHRSERDGADAEMDFEGSSARADLLLVGATEHVSVLAGGRFPPERVRQIPVDGNGVVQPDALAGLLDEAAAKGERALVSVMLANNETGVVQPIADLARVAHEAGAILHCDAIQAAGRIPVDIGSLGVDVLTLSAHKIGGPQGAGAIVRASEDLLFAPLLTGGGQERRLRGGTENVAAIAGFGVAAQAALADLDKAQLWSAWRDELASIMTSSGLAGTVFGAGVAAAAADAVHRARRDSGGNAGHCARPCRRGRLVGLRLLLRESRAEPRARRHGGSSRAREIGHSPQLGVGIAGFRLTFVRNCVAACAKARRAQTSGGLTAVPTRGP